MHACGPQVYTRYILSGVAGLLIVLLVTRYDSSLSSTSWSLPSSLYTDDSSAATWFSGDAIPFKPMQGKTWGPTLHNVESAHLSLDTHHSRARGCHQRLRRMSDVPRFTPHLLKCILRVACAVPPRSLSKGKSKCNKVCARAWRILPKNGLGFLPEIRSVALGVLGCRLLWTL